MIKPFPNADLMIANLTLIKKEKQISLLDYKAIKHSEGLIPEFEYSSVRIDRQIIRDEINALKTQIETIRQNYDTN